MGVRASGSYTSIDVGDRIPVAKTDYRDLENRSMDFIENFGVVARWVIDDESQIKFWVPHS